MLEERLLIAMESELVEEAARLIELGADVNAATSFTREDGEFVEGLRPIIFATAREHAHDFVCLLLEAGVDPRLCNADDVNTALHYAAFLGDLDVVRTLVDHQRPLVDVFGETAVGQTAEDLARQQDHQDVVDFFEGMRKQQALSLPPVSSVGQSLFGGGGGGEPESEVGGVPSYRLGITD